MLRIEERDETYTMKNYDFNDRHLTILDVQSGHSYISELNLQIANDPALDNI